MCVCNMYIYVYIYIYIHIILMHAGVPSEAACAEAEVWAVLSLPFILHVYIRECIYSRICCKILYIGIIHIYRYIDIYIDI